MTEDTQAGLRGNKKEKYEALGKVYALSHLQDVTKEQAAWARKEIVKGMEGAKRRRQGVSAGC